MSDALNHAELSRELALALGWKYVYPRSVETDVAWFRFKRDYIAVSEGPGPRGTMLRWRKFDYRDPTVVVPLIKWLMNHFCATVDYGRSSQMYWIQGTGHPYCAETLESAVARAVIAVRKG